MESSAALNSKHTFVLVDDIRAIDVDGAVRIDRHTYFADIGVYFARVESETREDCRQHQTCAHEH